MKEMFLNMILGKKNNILKIFLSFIIGLIFIYYAIKDFNFNKFSEVIINANYTLICISSILLIFTVYLRAYRWRIFVKDDCSLNFMYKAQLVGYFGNNILPLRLGEVLKTNIPFLWSLPLDLKMIWSLKSAPS